MILLLCLAAGLLVLDIVTKIISAGGGSFDIIPGVLSVFPWRNEGAAFGIFSGGGIWLILLTSVLIGLITVLYVLYKKKTTFSNVAFAFFLAGALGNLIDRIFLGYVRDFIQFDFISWFIGLFSHGYQFPICNLADVFLNAAIVMAAVYFLFLEVRHIWKNECNASEVKTEGVSESVAADKSNAVIKTEKESGRKKGRGSKSGEVDSDESGKD